jgi:hypothetical protein
MAELAEGSYSLAAGKDNGMMLEKPDCKLQSDFFTPGPQEFSLDTSHFR